MWAAAARASQPQPPELHTQTQPQTRQSPSGAEGGPSLASALPAAAGFTDGLAHAIPVSVTGEGQAQVGHAAAPASAPTATWDPLHLVSAAAPLSIRCPPANAAAHHAAQETAADLGPAYVLDVPMPDYGIRAPVLRAAAMPSHAYARSTGGGAPVPPLPQSRTPEWADLATAAVGLRDGWVPIAATAQVTAIDANGQQVVLPAVVLLDARSVSRAVSPSPLPYRGRSAAPRDASVDPVRSPSPTALPYLNIGKGREDWATPAYGARSTTSGGGSTASRKVRLVSHPIDLGDWRADD